jgi:hypothetical protein
VLSSIAGVSHGEKEVHNLGGDGGSGGSGGGGDDGGGGVRDSAELLSRPDSWDNFGVLSTSTASANGWKVRGRLEKRSTSRVGGTRYVFRGEGISCPRSR